MREGRYLFLKDALPTHRGESEHGVDRSPLPARPPPPVGPQKHPRRAKKVAKIRKFPANALKFCALYSSFVLKGGVQYGAIPRAADSRKGEKKFEKAVKST